MFNPNTKVNNITGLLTDPNAPFHIHGHLHKKNLKELCHPDMNWVYNKCMMTSTRFREMIEENHKSEITVDPRIVKNPKRFEIIKNSVVNDPKHLTYFDAPLYGTLQNYCSSLYTDQCRKFHEENLTDEKFVPSKANLSGTKFD